MAHGKESTCQCGSKETWVRSLGQEDPLEEETATHSSILALESPWTEELGGLQSLGHRVGPNLATKQQQKRLCRCGYG